MTNDLLLPILTSLETETLAESNDHTEESIEKYFLEELQSNTTFQIIYIYIHIYIYIYIYNYILYIIIYIIYANYIIENICLLQIFAFVTVLVFKLLNREVLFINRKGNRNC